MNEVFEELQAALYSAWHRRWLVLAIAWGVCILGWFAVAMIPNTYESKARVFVQLDDVLAQQIGVASAGKDEIERVRKTLLSSVNLEKVVRSTKLGEGVTTPSQMERAVGSLAEKIKVVSTEGNLFEITAQIGKSSLSDAENAALAQDVVQKMIDIFREENIAGSRGELAETLIFIEQQLEDRKRELEAAEQRRLAFEAQHPDLVGGTTSLSTKVQTLRAEMRGVDADLAAAQSALAAIQGQIAGTPRTLVTAGEAGGARGALIQARSQLAGLQARGLTDNHPDVAALKRQIELLERQAAREGPNASGTANPAYSSLVAIRAEREANVQALMARKAALQADLTGMMAIQADEPAVAAEANRISRDYEVLKQKYDELLQNREEMRLRSQVESERSSFRFEVVDPPSTPRAPAAPNRPILLIGVLILGAGAGVGVAFALSQVRSTFATGAKLERSLGLPVIGTISHTFTDATRAIARKRMKMFVAGCASLGGLCVLLLAVEFVQVGMVG